MITAILIMTIVSMVRGGNSPFLTPDLEKKIKQAITDPQHRKIILDILKAARLESKQLDRKMKRYKDLLVLLSADRATSREELNALFSAILAAYRQIQGHFISGRATIVDCMSNTEFESVIDRNFKPDDKAWRKLEKKVDDDLNGVATVVNQVIANHEHRDQLLAAVLDFKNGADEMLRRLAEWNYRDNKALGNYGATPEELRASFEEVNSFRHQVFGAFMDLHERLVMSTTKGEWKVASKAIKSLIN